MFNYINYVFNNYILQNQLPLAFILAHKITFFILNSLYLNHTIQV